mgnify:CR=1 FL=1
MFIRLVVFALISVIAIGCGATPTEKPESTQGESQSVVESPKTTTAVPPTPLPPTAAPPTAVSPKLASAIDDGTWVVGDDIQAGTYETSNEDGNCYWTRLSGFSGSFDDIVANDNPEGRAIVTIIESDKGFGSAGCGTWKRLESSG